MELGKGGFEPKPSSRKEVKRMLWLILGIILLAIAIAGGAIVHPVIFVLGILALFMAVRGLRTA